MGLGKTGRDSFEDQLPEQVSPDLPDVPKWRGRRKGSYSMKFVNTYTHVLLEILKSFFSFAGGMVLYMPRGSPNPLMFMCLGASQVVKNMQNIPMQETWEVWIRSLGQEDLLRESMVTHSSILA